MNPRKLTAGALTAVALSGGTVVAVDQQIDPYVSKDGYHEISLSVDEYKQGSSTDRIRIAKDKPEVTLERWGGDEALVVKKTGNYGASKRAWFSKQREWDAGKESVIVEPLQYQGKNVANAETQGEDGFKVDILLDEKPDTKVFTLELEGWEDLDFFYQGELTPEEIAEGAERPDNVIGSYAVYHKQKVNNCSNCGTPNYATGKLYHIYRPKILDSEGNWIWGQLHYESGILSVTVPQEFLDSAVYPVRVDPTFGYTTAGASFSGIGNNSVNGTRFTLSEAGDITKISSYVKVLSGTRVFKMGIWNQSDLSLVSSSISSEITTSDTSVHLEEHTYGASIPLSSADYYLGALSNTSFIQLAFDSTAPANYGFDDTSNNYAVPEALQLGVTNSSNNSIYATYTASGGSTDPDELEMGKWFLLF